MRVKPGLLSVVIPVFNEEARIGETLRRIRSFLDSKGFAFEIVVVDDGSKDRTPSILAALAADDQRIKLLTSPKNEGKGASVRRGVFASRGEIVLFSDADLSTPIEEMENLLPWLDSHPLVIASRSLPGSDVIVRQPAYREMMGRIFNFFVQALLLRGFVDTQCGFKMMTRRAADAIFRRQRINSFCFDVEVIVVAKRLGMPVKQVPVRWINSPVSRVHPVLDSAEMLLDLLRVKFYDIAGFYSRPV